MGQVLCWERKVKECTVPTPKGLQAYSLVREVSMANWMEAQVLGRDA